MLIKNKFNGYAIDGTRLYNFGGGGGGTSTSYTSNIPEYAQPYVETMLGATQQQLFNTDAEGQVTGFRPYAAYGAAIDDQGKILNTAQDQAKAAVAGFSPMQQQAQSGIANMRMPGQTEAASQMTANLAGRSLGAGQYDAGTFGTDSFTGKGTAANYMSPYMQNVVDIQTREAQRQADIAGTQRGAQAAGAGAFGGSRQAIMDAEAARNLAQQKGDIQAQGSQAAYQQAQAQFNAEQQRTQQAQQMAEQSKQYGAGLGMQGVQQAGAMASQLGALGQQQYGQQMGILGAQAQTGAQQQALEQARINQAMQNYATQQQYPMMQLGLMSNMLRGLPMQSSTTGMYAAQPSALNQIAGTYGAYDQYNKAQNTIMGKAEGGVIKKMAAGGIASGVDPYELPGMSKRLSDQQLNQKMKDRDTDPDTKGIMQGEIMRRKHVRGGMANGGVVAFAGNTDGSEVKEKDEGVGGRGAEPKGGIPAKLLRFLEGDSKVSDTKHGPSYRQSKNDPTNIRGRGQASAAVTPDTASTAVPLGLSGTDKGAVEYIDATKPAPVTKKVTTSAPAAPTRSDTAAPKLGGDSEEALYKKYIENAGKTSPEATAVLDQLGARAKMTPAQHYAESEGFRKEMGVDTKAMLEGQRETQRGMSEDVEKRGKYSMHMRNAQIFAKIASTPGPLLASAAKAMNDVIPEMIDDAEKQEKAQNEIKKALAALDMSEYLDKAGKADKALESRNAANVALMTAQLEIDKAKRDSQEKAMTSVGQVVASKRSDESRERSSSMRGAGGAGGEGKLDMAQNKAGDAEMARFEKSWAKRLENMERYAMAPEGSTAKTQSDKMRKQYEKERAAKEAQIAAEYPSKFRRGAPTADAAPTEADIAHTAKIHNMTVEQVKAELARLARNK